MRNWQKYLFECFKRDEFVELPKEIAGLEGMGRFSTYAELEKDVLTRNGPIACATLSLLFKPKVVVEFGTQVGWTTLLLCRLNPQAQVYSVDIEENVARQLGHKQFPTGYIPVLHKCPNIHLVKGNSWELEVDNVGLCFIDADHEEEPVWKDSWRAWKNRNKEGDWCIAWDDYHPNNKGVVAAVDKFCAEVGYSLQKAWSWYWIGTKSMTETELQNTGG